MQLPTGGGKTRIAGALLQNWLADGRKAAWLTHRKELSEQTRDMLDDDGVLAMTDVGWMPGSAAPATRGGVMILMAQTVGRRTLHRDVWTRYDAGDLMVVDEAHHATAAGWERAIRQWPGPVLGMTATPWRLSKTEGFDHLFGELICGPQTADLQKDRYLCPSRTVAPRPEQLILGGKVSVGGDYAESGIERANRDRPVMTQGALEFWRMHAPERQTVAYAVSRMHAHNLAAVFKSAGVPAAVILGDTDPQTRKRAIDDFRDRRVTVLVNVIVATEGFDLPDASCIIITRPTLSLALYLQMAGRGLRPESEDCLILDLANNAATHGLPEKPRAWSLEPRGEEPAGSAPVVRCEQCETVSPASNHSCPECGNDFGKTCQRCGKWRSRKRWLKEHLCGDDHDLVCDLCHIDAHIERNLPVVSLLDELIDDSEESGDVPTIRNEAANRLADLLTQLLRSELHATIDLGLIGKGSIDKEESLHSRLLAWFSPDYWMHSFADYALWREFWKTSREMDFEQAYGVIKEVERAQEYGTKKAVDESKQDVAWLTRAKLRTVLVRVRSGDWRPLHLALLPGDIVPSEGDRDRKVAIDTEFHHADLELLKKLGATAKPQPGRELWSEPYYGSYLNDCRDAFIDRPNIPPRLHRRKLSFMWTTGSGPLEVLRLLSDEGAARYTEALLELDNTYRQWAMRHKTVKRYPYLACSGLPVKFLRKHGRIRWAGEYVPFADVLGSRPANPDALHALLSHPMANQIRSAFDL